MLKPIETPHQDILAFSAVGTITKEDYTECLLPLILEARIKGRKINFLLDFGNEYEGFSPAAAWEDFKVGVHYLDTFARVAAVSDHQWLNNLITFFGHLAPCAVQTFPQSQLNSAIAWLNSGEIGFDHHLDEQKKCVTVEITAPLTSENFYLLSQTVDRWLEKGNELKGIIIHTKSFPGWKDLGSLFSHINFIKNHHQKIEKIALVADSEIAELAPKLASHFVKAQIKHFNYDEMKLAQSWIDG